MLSSWSWPVSEAAYFCYESVWSVEFDFGRTFECQPTYFTISPHPVMRLRIRRYHPLHSTALNAATFMFNSNQDYRTTDPTQYIFSCCAWVNQASLSDLWILEEFSRFEKDLLFVLSITVCRIVSLSNRTQFSLLLWSLIPLTTLLRWVSMMYPYHYHI